MSGVLEQPRDALVGLDCSLGQVPGSSLRLARERHGQGTVRFPAFLAGGDGDHGSPDQGVTERNPVGVAVDGYELGLLRSFEIGETPGRRAGCLEERRSPEPSSEARSSSCRELSASERIRDRRSRSSAHALLSQQRPMGRLGARPSETRELQQCQGVALCFDQHTLAGPFRQRGEPGRAGPRRRRNRVEAQRAVAVQHVRRSCLRRVGWRRSTRCRFQRGADLTVPGLWRSPGRASADRRRRSG